VAGLRRLCAIEVCVVPLFELYQVDLSEVVGDLFMLGHIGLHER